MGSGVNLLGDIKQVSCLCLSHFCKNGNNSSTYLVRLRYGFIRCSMQIPQHRAWHIASLQEGWWQPAQRRGVVGGKNLEKETESKHKKMFI